MIVVKIELHSAQTGEITEIGRMHLSNTGGLKGDKRGSYTIEVFKRGSNKHVQRHGLVTNFPKKSYSIWRLVLRALRNTFPEEHGS
jgi:hypothetical protein